MIFPQIKQLLHSKSSLPIAILSGTASPAVQLSKCLDVWLNNSGLTKLAHGDERAAEEVLTCKSKRLISAHQQNDYFIQSGMMRCFSELPTCPCEYAMTGASPFDGNSRPSFYLNLDSDGKSCPFCAMLLNQDLAVCSIQQRNCCL